VVAPSTAQDPEARLVRVALDALADEPVRVLATTNRSEPAEPWGDVPDNAVVVDWMSYSQVLPLADLAITHGGHGTVCRALGAGVPVLCCPAVGDMAENGARVQWAGAGLMLPWRLTHPSTLRWVVRRMLTDGSFAARARGFAAFAQEGDGAQRAAEFVEDLARDPAR
jgi:UDP:flavonoid glycosyltransferase YjiC (YdhE family)